MCQAITYYSDAMGRGAPITTRLLYEITAAKTLLAHDANAGLSSFDAIAAQSTIDNFLGTTSEFVIAQFDATSLGTDAIGFILNFGGQVDKLESIRCTFRSGTNLSTVVEQTVWGGPTLSSTSLTTGAAKGANGNVAARVVYTGLDALTAGQIEVTVYWRSK